MNEGWDYVDYKYRKFVQHKRKTSGLYEACGWGRIIFQDEKTLVSLKVSEKNIGEEKRVENTKQNKTKQKQIGNKRFIEGKCDNIQNRSIIRSIMKKSNLY